MSYFDPEIYNYEALKPEHKRLIDVYDMAKEDALNRDFIIEDKMGLLDDKSIIGRMKREIAEEVFDSIEEYLEVQRLEIIASIMEDDEDYYEKDPEEQEAPEITERPEGGE